MSPSPGFPNGARRIELHSDNEEWEDFEEDKTDTDIAAEKTSPKSQRESELLPVETGTEIQLQIPVTASQLVGEAYGSVHDELENRAAQGGFDGFSAVRKLGYLMDRKKEFEEITRKRKAEDDVHALWIAGKRWRTQYPDSPRSHGGTPLEITPEMYEDSDEDAMYERPALRVHGDELISSAGASASTMEELVRILGEAMQESHKDVGIDGRLGVYTATTLMSPLRFNHRPL